LLFLAENLFKKGKRTYGMILSGSREELMLVVQEEILEGPMR
jgi:hypothetical protein